MKKILSTAIICLGMGATLAHAANLTYDKQLLEEAVALSQSNSPRPGRPGYGRGRPVNPLREIEVKVSSVRRDIETLGYSQDKLTLQRSLDEALRALRDRWLTVEQVMDAVEYRGEESLRVVNMLLIQEANQNYNPFMQSAQYALGRSSLAVSNMSLQTAASQLALAKQDLLNIRIPGDRYVDIALSQIARAQSLLGGSFDYYRVNEFRTLVSDASRNIGLSPNYRTGAIGQLLGETGQFNTARASLQTIYVGRQAGALTHITMLAKGASIRVENVRIAFANGNTKDFPQRQRIVAGDRLSLDLPGAERGVISVTITAQSLGNVKGSLVLRGILR